MKEWGGCERGDAGGGGGQQQQCKARERGQQPAVFYKLPFKRNQQRDGGGRREKGVQGPGAGLCRDVLTLPPLRHGCAGQRAQKKKQQNKRIQFRHGRRFRQMRRDGNVEGSAADRRVLEISPVSVVYLASSPRVCVCVCRKKRETTLQDVVYIKVLA